MNYFNLIFSNKSILRIFQLEIFKKFKIEGDIIEFGASEKINKNFCEPNLENCKVTFSNIDSSNKEFLNIDLQKTISLNTKFDPERHQAVSKKESELPEGMIVEELQKGFMIGERLLRPAMVIVSAGKSEKKEI